MQAHRLTQGDPLALSRNAGQAAVSRGRQVGERPAWTRVSASPAGDRGMVPRLLPHLPLGARMGCDVECRLPDCSWKVLLFMRLLCMDPLFPWPKLPDGPDRVALRFLLDLLSDQSLLDALHSHRGHGRNDVPVPVFWRMHLGRGRWQGRFFRSAAAAGAGAAGAAGGADANAGL